MKVFLDTNVIMVYLCNRIRYRQAKEILDAAYIKAYDVCMSSGCVYTISYLLARHLKEKDVHEPENTQTVRETINSLMEYVEVVDLKHSSFKQGLDDLTFKDLEDSYQYYCAIENDCDILVTFNMKDFVGEHSQAITLMPPKEFVDKYIVWEHEDLFSLRLKRKIHDSEGKENRDNG